MYIIIFTSPLVQIWSFRKKMVGRGGSSSVKVEPRYLTRSAKKRFREEPESTKDTESSTQATNTKGSGKNFGSS